MTLAAMEFIPRFLLHVLPNRFMKIRYYGFLANTNKSKHYSPVPFLVPMASGAAVLDDKSMRARIEEQHRKLYGIEMETYAVYLAAQEAKVPRPYFFSLKSVVDYADGMKNDEYHKYASYTSSQTLKKFVEHYL